MHTFWGRRFFPCATGIRLPRNMDVLTDISGTTGPNASFRPQRISILCFLLRVCTLMPNRPGTAVRRSGFGCSGCRFWARIQRNNGTFDEWLPYEQSHVATAFSMAMITEAILLFEMPATRSILDGMSGVPWKRPGSGSLLTMTEWC